MSNWMIAAVGIVYFSVGMLDFKNGNYPWGIIWTGYALAQVGMIWARVNHGG